VLSGFTQAMLGCVEFAQNIRSRPRLHLNPNAISINQRVFRRARAAKPEMLHPIFSSRAHGNVRFRRMLAGMIHHENLAFAKINQRRGAGRVRAFCQHWGKLFCGKGSVAFFRLLRCTFSRESCRIPWGCKTAGCAGECGMEPTIGLEPMTCRLRIDCSTN
jgi:hypothetical protein